MTKNILEWLEVSCLKHPNKIAVADETAEMTYEELVKDAKILGTKLATYIQPRQAVAMYMERVTLHLRQCMVLFMRVDSIH